MRKIFFNILKLSCIFFISIEQNNLLAQGTWIEVYRSNFKPTNTVAANLDIGGIAHFIDMKSFVMNGDIAYFNWSIVFFNKNGKLRKNHITKLNELHQSGRINCRNNTVYITKDNGTWIPITKDKHKFWISVSDVLCEDKERKFKFW